jgi:ATP-binding protein involved in chromosome partitioning
LEFTKSTDPFLNSIKNSIKEKLENNFGSTYIINIVTKTKKVVKPKIKTTAGVEEVANIIAIASGKGGVGKSTITVNLAVALAQMGYKCGVVDADIFGPSIPKMFGIENEKPSVVVENGKELIVPVEKYGIKILSIDFLLTLRMLQFGEGLWQAEY